MALAQSKVTAQGRTSIPTAVRKRLGVARGSILEWNEEDGKIVVRRVGKYTCEDIHKVLFPDGPPKTTVPEGVEEGNRGLHHGAT